jgi:hypothetical protein
MKTLLITLIILTFSLLTQAQITLTHEDVLNLIGTYETFNEDISQYPFAVDVGPAGENQTWYFSDISFPYEQNTQAYLSPEGTPFFDNFPTANLAAKISFMIDTLETSAYSYIEVTENKLNFLGSAVDHLGVIEIETTEDFAPLPITYGTEWMITRYDTLESYPAFTTVQVETVLAKIDGWGSVTVPAGTFECLRLQTNWTEYIHTIVDNVIVLTDTTIGSDFSWMSKTSIELVDFNFEAPNYSEADDLKILIDKGVSNLRDNPRKVHQYVLKQNYPNPFNPKTIINYELRSTNNVDLIIYNVLGQKVVTLVSEKQSAGKYSVEWDASNYSSGIYYYKIQSGEYQDVKKMILMR